ncbi:MAG: hypothetical protein Q7S54_00310 [bacterium]|nr:hypothetical protein [bacterium]
MSEQVYMIAKVWEKVEYVRTQPEHIRMRYVVACLLISMVFIVGIWMLSLRENFGNAAADLSFPKEKALLENSGVPSLQDLLKNSAPLQVENESQAPMTGEEYFLNQFNQSKQEPGAEQNNLEGEGINPNQNNP